MSSSYDAIVIGAGAAGCVIAARLSEDSDRRVLLIEAGGHNRRLSVKAPAAFAAQFGTKIDWDYWTEPEENLLGRRLQEPRGKQMGGCSSMNAMMYVRGSRYDYDSWAAEGAPGWSADEVLPFFKRSEHNADLRDEYHASGGPLHIETSRTPDPVTGRLIDACVQSGMDRLADINGAQQDGVTYTQVNVRKGIRQDTATAFLAPARRRPNLTVMTGALVHRVLLRGGRAVGVELSRGRRTETVTAASEVILAAGAFGTPEILQRSGIGPSDHLRSVGVSPVVDLPAVGHHLQEHPLLLLHWELEGGAIGLADASDPRHLARWLITRKGKLASNVAEGVGFFRTDSSLPAADMEVLLAPAFFCEHGQREHPRPAFSIGMSLVAPTSQGSVLIGSPDPTQKGHVRLRMLSHDSEMRALMAAVHKARDIANQPALDALRGVEITPGPWVRDEGSLAEWIRGTVQHTYHPACTARMGTPETGACDEQLRVHGVDGLRVGDASAMPTVTRGNTHAPSIMIGERCADFIRTGGPAPRPLTGAVSAVG